MNRKLFCTLLVLLVSILAGCKSEPGPATVDEPAGTESILLGDGKSAPMIISDDFGVEMAQIPEGSFMMGGDADLSLDECSLYYAECELGWFEPEEPIHKVTLDAFYIDVHEVTNAHYAECVADGACKAPANIGSENRVLYFDDPQFADYPVIYVSWEDAQAYCEWRGARLPTEAEWEKAARGGLEGMLYPWGNEDPLCKAGVVNGAKFDDDSRCNAADTDPVGTYSPNGYGLYDIAGNVFEWVADWYGVDYYADSPDENPLGPQEGERRVVRGGAWSSVPAFIQIVHRGGEDPGQTNNNLGFRCARLP